MWNKVAVMDLGLEELQPALPPSYWFHPTSEEVVAHYLIPKICNPYFSCHVVSNVNLNNNELWDLPIKCSTTPR